MVAETQSRGEASRARRCGNKKPLAPQDLERSIVPLPPQALICGRMPHREEGRTTAESASDCVLGCASRVVPFVEEGPRASRSKRPRNTVAVLELRSRFVPKKLAAPRHPTPSSTRWLRMHHAFRTAKAWSFGSISKWRREVVERARVARRRGRQGNGAGRRAREGPRIDRVSKEFKAPYDSDTAKDVVAEFGPHRTGWPGRNLKLYLQLEARTWGCDRRQLWYGRCED